MPSATRRISVMVVDAQALFRHGLVRLLEDDDRLEVVAVSAGGHEVSEACVAMSVDVLVTDLEPDSVDGIQLTRTIRALCPLTRVLILTSVVDSRVTAAIASGAVGFLLKDAEPEAIRSAVVAVHLGEHVLCPEAAKWLLDDAPPHHHRLTLRETEVLRLVAGGSRNKDIAQRLHVSDKTARNYVSRVYQKLALRNRSQARLYALQTGIAAQVDRGPMNFSSPSQPPSTGREDGAGP